MSSLRKRQTPASGDTPAKKEVRFEKRPGVTEYIQNALQDLRSMWSARGKDSRTKTKKSAIKRIEESSLLRYVVLFVLVFTCSILLTRYLHELTEDHTIAGYHHEFTRLFIPVSCSDDYKNTFEKCAPKKCGRSIRDNLFSEDTLTNLRNVAERGFALGGGSGGASILDLHSGALSYQDKFVNIYKMKTKVFNETDFALYKQVKDTVKDVIAKEFEIEPKHLHLAHPTFFSRMNANPAVTLHDEYWHTHIDKVTYGTFYYTSLLYLSSYHDDFTGGRFVFVDNPSNKTVEPRMGRLSFFTSGSENEHFVERVESGTRYAITIAFTCDPNAAIRDPSMST